jgi:hypothetical protein
MIEEVTLHCSAASTYIFTGRTCPVTIITLEPCALNDEFQHFILRFNKISLLCLYHWKEGIGGEREGDFTDYFNEKPKYKRFDDF